MKTFEVTYTITIKEKIKANDLTEACAKAQKKAIEKKMIVQSVIPIN